MPGRCGPATRKPRARAPDEVEAFRSLPDGRSHLSGAFQEMQGRCPPPLRRGRLRRHHLGPSLASERLRQSQVLVTRRPEPELRPARQALAPPTAPPKGERLTAEQVGLLRAWINFRYAKPAERLR